MAYMIMRSMLLQFPAVWLARIVSFVFAALAAGSAAYWGLRWSSLSQADIVSVAPVDAPQQWAAQTVAVEKALGGLGGSPDQEAPQDPNPPLLESRFELKGVIAGTTSQVGAALIGIDGQPPRPFKVGTSLEDEWMLKSVQGRSAVLARAVVNANSNDSASEQLVLEMPSVNQDAKKMPSVNQDAKNIQEPSVEDELPLEN